MLLLVGEADLMIPSGEEGKRLQKALPRASLRTFPRRSHALLQEAGIRLADIIKVGEMGCMRTPPHNGCSITCAPHTQNTHRL